MSQQAHLSTGHGDVEEGYRPVSWHEMIEQQAACLRSPATDQSSLRPTTPWAAANRPETASTAVTRPTTAWTTKTLMPQDSLATLVPDIPELPGKVEEQPQKMPKLNEQTKYLTKSRIIMVFAACAVVNFAALLDQTSLAAAHVIIGQGLHAGDSMPWISGAYFVTSTAFQLLYGRLSDIFSRKIILLNCIAIFFAGSLASSFAESAFQLIIFRAVTGIGGGGLVTGAQMIVSDVVPLRERGKYQGILGAAMAVANAVGPVHGGLLASQTPQSWRWIFRINLFLSSLMVLAVVFFMPLRKVQGSWKVKLNAIDFFGAFLALAGSVVLMLGLTWAGGQYSWGSIQVLSTLAVGGAFSILFILWQWKGTKFPLIPMHVFKSRIVCGGSLTMFIHGWLFIVQLFYIPTLYQLLYGYSATKAGLLLLPVTLVQTFSSTLAGMITSWTGRYKENICVGWALWSVGLWMFSTITISSNLAERIGYAALTGFGAGLTLQASLVAMQAGVERKEMAVITSFRNFIRNLGSTLGLAVSGTMINNSVRRSFKSAGLSNAHSVPGGLGHVAYSFPEDNQMHDALVSGYHSAFKAIFMSLAAMGVLAFFLALVSIPQVDLRRPDDNALGRQQQQENKEMQLIGGPPYSQIRAAKLPRMPPETRRSGIWAYGKS